MEKMQFLTSKLNLFSLHQQCVVPVVSDSWFHTELPVIKYILIRPQDVNYWKVELRTKIRVVHGYYHRAILLTHGGNSVRIVSIRQMFLCIKIGRKNQRFTIPGWCHHSPAVSRSKLVGTSGSSAKIERRSRETQTCLNTGHGLYMREALDFLLI